ncbi:MAG: hypothetical protein ACK5PQ_05180 [Alphaproteobacteria bacterium]
MGKPHTVTVASIPTHAIRGARCAFLKGERIERESAPPTLHNHALTLANLRVRIDRLKDLPDDRRQHALRVDRARFGQCRVSELKLHAVDYRGR